MATVDIFEGDAFEGQDLTRALENIPYKPATLSGSGLFGPRGVRSRTVVIESRDGTLSLIRSQNAARPMTSRPRSAAMCGPCASGLEPVGTHMRTLPPVQEAGRDLGCGNPAGPRLWQRHRHPAGAGRSRPQAGPVAQRRRDHLRVSPLQWHPGAGERSARWCDGGEHLHRVRHYPGHRGGF